jgi:hypothetical protein
MPGAIERNRCPARVAVRCVIDLAQMTEQLEQKQIQCTEMESYGSIRRTLHTG